MTSAASMSAGRPNPDEVARFAFRVWSYKQGEMVSLLIHLGDRLGLYRVLDHAGTVTAWDLGGLTGLHPRWLREWLRGNAAAELLVSDDGERFELTAVGAAVLAREDDSLQFAAGAFGPPPDPALVDDLADAFRTGIWLPYDRQGHVPRLLDRFVHVLGAVRARWRGPGNHRATAASARAAGRKTPASRASRSTTPMTANLYYEIRP